MSNTRILFCALLLTCSACTTTQELSSSSYQAPESGYKLVVMEPDISVGLLTMGGVAEPREDWTNQATENVLRALANHQELRGGNTTIAMTLEDAGGDTAALRDLTSLHNAVGQAIFVHKYAGLKLPTKKDKFDWTLGDTAVEFGQQTDFDYALFLHAQSTYSSAARKGLQFAGLLSCAVGVCVGVSGGQQVAFVSLVDLDTGRVTWFNVLSSVTTDIRTQEGADNLVANLLATMDESSSQ